MSAQHTPGPWRVGDAGATVFGPPNGNPAPKVICTLTYGMATGSKRADARLIAAAPMMYEVLRELADEIDQSYIFPRITVEIWDKVRAAIAQAEGKS